MNLNGSAEITKIAGAIAAVFVVSLAASHGGNGHFLDADDSNSPSKYLNTTPSSSYGGPTYPTPAAFLGSDVWTASKGNFNITNSTGGLVENVTNGQMLSTESTNASSEGRYYVWNETVPTSHTAIDLLSSSNDVVGRVQGNVTNPRIELRYWENKSLIADESSDPSVNSVNITQPNQWQTGEYIYRMNTSLEKYWIGIRSDNTGWKYTPSRGIEANTFQGTIPSVNKPRVNDLVSFAPGETNLSGRIVNKSGPMEGLKVKVTGVRSFCSRCINRSPRTTTPPVETDFTDSNGFFNVSGLNTGSGQRKANYKVAIANDSLSRINGSFFAPDAELNDTSLNDFYAGEFNATENVGEINGTIKGKSSGTYVLAVFSSGLESGAESFSKFSIQEDLDNVSLKAIPNGSYSLVAANFGSSSGPSDLISKSVSIKDGETTTVNLEFPEKVELSGNVTADGNPLANASVYVRNSSEFKFKSTETASNGSYSLKVANDTGYNLEVRPRFKSKYRSNTTQITVSGPTTQNMSVSEGKSVKGVIEDGSGNPVKARVTVSKESESDFLYESDVTNSSGEYRINGLSTGETYKFDVYPYESGISENHSSFTLNSDGQWRNVTLGSATAEVYGYVEDSNGNSLKADVSLINYENDSRVDVRTNSTGGYSFSDLPENNYYSLRIKPDNDSLSAARESFILNSDKRENFTLATFSGLEGYVKDSGSGIEGAEVFVYNFSEDRYGWTTTDSNGRYQVDIEAGEYDMDVRKEGYPLNETSVVVGSSGNTVKNVTLSKGESLSGYIKKNGKETSFNGTISVWNRSSSSFGYSDIENGEYNISGLQDTGHEVWISIEKDSIDSKITEVSKPSSYSGNQKNFSVETNSGQKLNVTVKDNDGDKLKDATVQTSRREKVTNSEGYATFPQQPVETITVNVNKDGYKGVQREVSISKPGQGLSVPNVKDINVTLESVNEIKVDVNVTKNGEGVGSASVVLVSNETGVSQSSSAVTGSSGEATVKGLTEGDYLLTLGIDEDTVVNGAVNLNTSEGWKSEKPFEGSNYDLWYNARR